MHTSHFAIRSVGACILALAARTDQTAEVSAISFDVVTYNAVEDGAGCCQLDPADPVADDGLICETVKIVISQCPWNLAVLFAAIHRTCQTAGT